VARGTQHIRKRPKQAAPKAPQRGSEVRRARRESEQGMFFPLLRRQARWVFVLLAGVFALSFVFLGVGSGSTGLGDILNGWLNNNGGSGSPSTSKLEKETREHPKDAKALRELVTAYETDQRINDAATALERYVTLRPKDVDAAQELTGLYQRQLQELSGEAQAAQAETPTTDASAFRPASTSPLGQAYAASGALQDPIDNAATTSLQTKFTELQTRADAIQTRLLAASKRAVALDPTDPTAQYQLAQVADAKGDTAAALAAYKAFLKLSPDDPLASTAKDRIKQLSKPASATAG